MRRLPPAELLRQRLAHRRRMLEPVAEQADTKHTRGWSGCVSITNRPPATLVYMQVAVRMERGPRSGRKSFT